MVAAAAVSCGVVSSSRGPGQSPGIRRGQQVSREGVHGALRARYYGSQCGASVPLVHKKLDLPDSSFGALAFP